jgi:hypothetical protein
VLLFIIRMAALRRESVFELQSTIHGRALNNLMICIFHRSSVHTAGDVTCVRVERLLLTCEISSPHGGEYDVQSCLLGYTAV